MVQEFSRNKNSAQIKKLIETFSTQYCISKDPNKRKGGLIALASCSIALGAESGSFIGELLTPVLACLLDPDTRVRYFASESLYNIVKVARQAIIPSFPEIFSALSRLVADADASVKNASELLDRLLKDIITENSQIFDLPSFVPLLRERVLTKNSFARQFLISWISVSFSIVQNVIIPNATTSQRFSMQFLRSTCSITCQKFSTVSSKCSKIRCLRSRGCAKRCCSSFSRT